MKPVLNSLAFSLLAFTTLLGCEKEMLSVGELRCQGVSCAPHHNEPVDEVVEEDAVRPSMLLEFAGSIEPEHVVLSETIEAKRVPLPCPFDGTCLWTDPSMRLLEHAGEASVVLVSHLRTWSEDAPNEPTEDHGLWIGRYADGEWLSESLTPGEGTIGNDHHYSGALATAAGDRADAIVVVSETIVRDDYVNALRAYAYGADDKVELLFEHDDPVSLHDAALIGEDLLVVAAFEHQFLELTRYARDGKVLFRQSALASVDEEIGPYAANAVGQAQLEVIDDDTIVVLVPRFRSYEVLVLDGQGTVQWSAPIGYAEMAANPFGAQLSIDDEGGILVGLDGYTLRRFEREGETLRTRRSHRWRTEYYDLSVYGLDTADSGFSYFGTYEGVLNDRRTILERVSPDLETIESAQIEPLEEPCESVFHDEAELVVARDESVAFTLSEDCFLELPLAVFAE